MKNLLKRPVINSICLTIFTMFYVICFTLANFSQSIKSSLYYANNTHNSLMKFWSRFLNNNGFLYLAIAFFVLTTVLIFFISKRKKSYDEYQTTILTNCLVISLILTLVAIGVFFVIVLIDPVGIIEKIVLLVTINWTSVFISNFAFIGVCNKYEK